MNTDKFSVDFFKEALSLHIEKNKEFVKPVHAANSFYRSMVSSIIYDTLNKNFELIRRLKNLDAAYNAIKQTIQNVETKA